MAETDRPTEQYRDCLIFPPYWHWFHGFIFRNLDGFTKPRNRVQTHYLHDSVEVSSQMNTKGLIITAMIAVLLSVVLVQAFALPQYYGFSATYTGSGYGYMNVGNGGSMHRQGMMGRQSMNSQPYRNMGQNCPYRDQQCQEYSY
jgi:hypothetical protein